MFLLFRKSNRDHQAIISTLRHSVSHHCKLYPGKSLAFWVPCIAIHETHALIRKSQRLWHSNCWNGPGRIQTASGRVRV